MTTETVKLSELADDVEVSIEESSTVYTVAQLKREILELGEPHYENSNWCTIVRQKWAPSAERMIESYIENEACDMYEDWDERAWERINKRGLVEEFQNWLDSAFSNGYATDYWTYDKSIIIDILPPEVEREFNELTSKYGRTKGILIFHGMSVEEVISMSDEDAEGAVEALPDFL